MRRSHARAVTCAALALSGGPAPARAPAQITALWQPVTISPAAIADDPQLATMSCLDLMVTTTGDWDRAGLYAQLESGYTFYKHGLAGLTRPDPSLVAAHPALAYTTYVTAPSDTGTSGAPRIVGALQPSLPFSLGDASSWLPGVFTGLWRSLEVDAPGTWQIARFTFPQDTMPNVVQEIAYPSTVEQTSPPAAALVPDVGPSIRWLNDVSGEWGTAANWDRNRLPQWPDNVLIDVGGPAIVREIRHVAGQTSVASVSCREHLIIAGGSFSIGTSDFGGGGMITLRGGTISASRIGGAPLRVAAADGELRDVLLNDGMFIETGPTPPRVIGELTLNGIGTLAPAAALRFAGRLSSGPQALRGSGTLLVGAYARVLIDGVGSLTIDGGMTVRGASAAIGASTPGTPYGAKLINRGRIIAEGDAPASTFVVNAADLTNSGTLEARNGRRLLVASDHVALSGQIVARGAGSIVEILPANANIEAPVLWATQGRVEGDGAVRALRGMRLEGVLLKGGPGTFRLNDKLDMFPGSTIDIAGGTFVYDYVYPDVSIRELLIAGYASGSWDGSGINSSTAAADPTLALGHAEAAALFSSFPATFAGEAIDQTTALVRLVRYGDANLDGAVNLQDFNRLAGHFGATSGAVWTDGDFNYDGSVDLTDFNLLAANFGQSAAGSSVTPGDWSALASAVPEPDVAGLVVLSGALAGARRRRG